MDKVDIIRKHIGNDDFYDMNGTPLLTKILVAMDEYAQQQVKNCSIPDVSNLAKFCKKISQQKDCPAEFTDIVNKEFWNLI